MVRRGLIPAMAAALVVCPVYLVCPVCLVGLGAAATAQESTSGPGATSGEALIREGVAVIAANALGGGDLDWDRLERELLARFGTAEPHAALAAAVAMLDDPHAGFSPPPPIPVANPAPTSGDATPASPPAADNPQPSIPVVPEGRLLEDGVAYLVVPGCQAPDVEGLRAYAKAAALELARLKQQQPTGWLVDLRLNGGGNLWPMLLGLGPLLSDGPLMTMVKDGQVQARYGLGEGCAWIDWGRGAEPQLAWGTDGAPATMAPTAGRLALLTGPWTMSSGEALAICLLGRAATRSFGEPTAGLTTVTNQYRLADGSVLTLPVAQMGHRDGRPETGTLAPMQAEPGGDWPGPADAAALAARAWLLE